MRGDEIPRHLRMFVDDVSEIMLWSHRGEDHLEDRLPISESLRTRLKSWLDEYTRSISNTPAWSVGDNVDHDRRGFALCAELQKELGSDFEIEYHFHTDQARRDLGS
jgi:hypothetical protein